MIQIELQQIHDSMLTMSSLSADIALFLKGAIDDESIIDADWVEKFVEKMSYMAVVSNACMATLIGEEAVATINETIQEAYSNGLPE